MHTLLISMLISSASIGCSPRLFHWGKSVPVLWYVIDVLVIPRAVLSDAPRAFTLSNDWENLMDTKSYDNTEAFLKGLQVRREVLGDGYVEPSIQRGTDDPFTRKLQQFATEHCWGTVWCSDGLDRKTRSTINLALLAALGRPAELRLHTRGAITNGMTKDEIAEVFLKVAVYAGAPAAVEAFREAKAVFDEMGI